MSKKRRSKKDKGHSMQVLATYSIKGGVGKTATAVNLAYLAAVQQGARVLLWDLDPQAAATYYFRVKPKLRGGVRKLVSGDSNLASRIRGTDFEGLDLLPGDFSYRHLDVDLDGLGKPRKRLRQLLAPLAADYDYVLFDCAPSISIVSETVFQVADALIVPVIPTPLSIRTLAQLRKHLERNKVEVPVLPFYCMVDRRKSLHRELLDQSSQAKLQMLETSIPYSTWVERMGIERAPLAEFARSTAAARAYRELWWEIWGQLSRAGSNPPVE